MCLRRVPEKYIAGAALDRADLHGMGWTTGVRFATGAKVFSSQHTDRFWGPVSLVFICYWGFFPQE
jgi:hypothetical protein